MTHHYIKLGIEGPVASLVFNRPNVLNAFHNETMGSGTESAKNGPVGAPPQHDPAGGPLGGSNKSSNQRIIRGSLKRLCRSADAASPRSIIARSLINQLGMLLGDRQVSVCPIERRIRICYIVTADRAAADEGIYFRASEAPVSCS
jgi:hypothetical protein